MDLNSRKIVVVGAGIGGLAVALALKAHGADVMVLEQSEAITEVGAGLQISPNGVNVLRALGLEPALRDQAVRGKAVQLRDYRAGGEVLTLDLDRYASDSSYYFVHRADLISMLAEAVRHASIPVRLLQKVERVQAGPAPVLHMANGARINADLVVGADGLHSKARVALNGEDTPFFTGQVAWRAVVPNDLCFGAQAQVFMGPGRHMVCYPLRRGELVNIVAVQEREAWADEGWNQQDDPAHLRAAFGDFGGPVPALLNRIENVRLWGLFRHPVAPNWHSGCVAILGDAAHPTLPFLAQGANMALEDAWVLADSLAKSETPGEALTGYQRRRRDRAVRVIAAANNNAWKYHLSSASVRAVAHMTLRMGGRLAPRRMVRQFDWLYGHDVTKPG
ncbi:FAD-dependent monooxygenase [Primorskyibacter sp. S87]|uniref:FAD-dependent monooxygenase n=1 Tax=Primorskyibacter sp. S87 TaxID=3415126 RepID=UPI003C7C90B8